MEFTSRLKQILSVLLKEENAIPVKTLAEQTGISKRTVQRELEGIDYALKDYKVTFMSKTGVGIWLEGCAEEKDRLLQDIGEGDDYDVTNKEERRKRLILEILKEKGLKKLFYYSSQFGVSEATISSDLEAAGEWLSRFGLMVTRRPGSGISIEGSEEDYRRAIRAFINENMDTKVLREAYEDAGNVSGYENLKKSSIGQLLNDDILTRTRDCIMGMDKVKILTLTENSYVGLLIHISIAINRILKNEVIEPPRNWFDDETKDEDYRLAEEIVKELEEEFEIDIPKVEISYICLHIKGAKHEKIRWDDKTIMEVGNQEMQQLVNEMIDVFDENKAYLMKQDDEFIQGLLAHLQPTMIRLLHGMQIHNPVLEDIKSHYPGIYERCGKVADVLEEHTGKKVPEEEIGYLTVHFGAALVRLKEREEVIRKVSIGVVCSSGIGISRLMSSKLLNTFKDRVSITTYGKNDITPFVVSKADFFVSSIPLEQMEIPVIFVNPLLNAEDMQKIQQMVYQYERAPMKQNAKDTFSIELEEINLVAAQIRSVIKYLDFFKVDDRIGFDELLIAVGERMSPYSDRRERIREDIYRREQIATQVFAELGFALLHATTKGVVRPQFAVCMTKDLTPFKDPYFKGIKVVFIMLVPEDENLRINRDIMGYTSSMLIEEYDFLDIVSRGDQEEIRFAVSKNLKKYFNRYLAELS